MGVRINMENKIEAIDNRLKLVEDAVEEIIKKVDDLIENNTRVHHVDLHEDLKETLDDNPMHFTKGTEVKPDETPEKPKAKKRVKAKAESA
jgi:regulator of replication initiation timing